MKIKRIIFYGLLGFLALSAISGVVISLKVKSQVKELFKMNKHLQEEGYYMAEFEFHMVGLGYLLGKGEFVKALKSVSEYHALLSDKNNLIKIPDFESKQEEIDFYLNLQNPTTGAFMDDSAPFCTYFSNTENMLLHLEALQDSTTKPLRLKYALVFLDEINTPEKLVAYLNDISYMNKMGAMFPQTSFHFARDIFSNADPDNVIERNNLYQFSTEWKNTILKWMYEFQDVQTGLWGPKNRKSKKLLKSDINNTYSIVKKYRDTNSADIYAKYPLQYGRQLFSAALEQLSEPIPKDDALEWVHEWNLKQAKGIKMLLALLWNDATEEQKEAAKNIIVNFIQVSFDKYYVENDGAFSYYPNSEHATVDGMNNMIFKRIGALSYERQKQYWGTPEENTKELESISINMLRERNFEPLTTKTDIISWRFYSRQPDFKKLYKNVWAVYYPNETNVVDITELIPNILKWTETSSLSTGNWKSMADIKKEYAFFNIKKPLIYKQEFPYTEVNSRLQESSEIYLIGFDILQIPRYRIKLVNVIE